MAQQPLQMSLKNSPPQNSMINTLSETSSNDEKKTVDRHRPTMNPKKIACSIRIR